MRIVLRIIATIAFVSWLPQATIAQHPRYRVSPNDTLRYREVIESHIELRPPRGPVTITGRREATIAIVSTRGDTAAAWYEQLTSSTTDPTGEHGLPMDSALHLPFALLLAPSGRLTLLSAPVFPPEIARRTDLSHEFEDFFISLPDSALRPGRPWADTVENSVAGRSQDTYQARHIRRFRVLRDTVVAATNAVVIAVDQTITVRSTSPMESQPVTISVELDGREQGTAVFAPSAGRMLARARHAHLEGQQVLQGQSRRLVVPMTYDYSSSLSLLP